MHVLIVEDKKSLALMLKRGLEEGAFGCAGIGD